VTDRTAQLLDKAEEATDHGDIEQADAYMRLAETSAFLARKQAKSDAKVLAQLGATGRTP